jgi:hypothetical protein
VADPIKASKKGIELIEKARKAKQWNKTESDWIKQSLTSRSTLNRFWSRESIEAANFKAICNAVGANWFEVAEWANESDDSDVNSLDIINTNEIRWVGRQALITELVAKLQADCRVLSLVGITGIGKTSLAARLCVDTAIRQTLPVLKVISFDQQLPNFESVVKCLLGEAIATDPEMQKQPDKMVMLAVGALRSRPCLLVLDMAEVLIKTTPDGIHQFTEPAFQEFLDQVIKADQMPSRIVLTSQYRTPELAEGRYLSRRESISITGLAEVEALELFQVWDIYFEEAEKILLQRIIQVYEGHPLAMRVIAGDIKSFEDVQAYWAEYGQEIEEVENIQNLPEIKNKGDRPRLDRYSLSLEDLVMRRVESTFNRLNQTSQLAYLMICMISAYRCAVEKSACLIMIEDFCTSEQAKLAFLTLQRRFLLEEEKFNSRRLYRLHNIIRRVALDHLERLDER